LLFDTIFQTILLLYFVHAHVSAFTQCIFINYSFEKVICFCDYFRLLIHSRLRNILKKYWEKLSKLFASK